MKLIRILARILQFIIEKKWSKPVIPLDGKQMALSQELRKEYRNIIRGNFQENSPLSDSWSEFLKELETHVINDDPRTFLRWNLVKKVMAPANLSPMEYCFLKSLPDWESRWKNIVSESSSGHPVPFLFYPKSSWILLQHASHAAVFERHTGQEIKELRTIFEFGGGFGSLCRVFYKLGFKGKYIIFDFPHLSALQKYFLRSLGLNSLNIASNRLPSENEEGAWCISQIDLLQELLKSQKDLPSSLFIATWSLSESPMETRDKIIPLLQSFQYMLITYQKHFDKIDNDDFFRNNFIQRSEFKEMKWYNWEIPYFLNNFYLIGQKT